ncbi:MAG TPA: hypothetical protein VHK24_06460 [Steroidobacter sp.]|nr:hypothetical protein [Steroidobacter sp.]
MDSPPTSAVDLAVTHLNAPVGRVLTKTEFADAFKAGTLRAVHRHESVALLCYLFVEFDPQLIIRCVNELRSGLLKANELYNDTLRANAPRSLNWERSVAHLL